MQAVGWLPICLLEPNVTRHRAAASEAAGVCFVVRLGLFIEPRATRCCEPLLRNAITEENPMTVAIRAHGGFGRWRFVFAFGFGRKAR